MIISALNCIQLPTTAGITLALFGGVRKHSMDQNKVPVRGDIHVIVVGMQILAHALYYKLKLHIYVRAKNFK